MYVCSFVSLFSFLLVFFLEGVNGRFYVVSLSPLKDDSKAFILFFVLNHESVLVIFEFLPFLPLLLSAHSNIIFLFLSFFSSRQKIVRIFYLLFISFIPFPPRLALYSPLSRCLSFYSLFDPFCPSRPLGFPSIFFFFFLLSPSPVVFPSVPLFPVKFPSIPFLPFLSSHSPLGFPTIPLFSYVSLFSSRRPLFA